MGIYKKELKGIKQNLFLSTQTFFTSVIVTKFKTNDIEKIYITASGGPFLNLPKKAFQK